MKCDTSRGGRPTPFPCLSSSRGLAHLFGCIPATEHLVPVSKSKRPKQASRRDILKELTTSRSKENIQPNIISADLQGQPNFALTARCPCPMLTQRQDQRPYHRHAYGKSAVSVLSLLSNATTIGQPHIPGSAADLPGRKPDRRSCAHLWLRVWA